VFFGNEEGHSMWSWRWARDSWEWKGLPSFKGHALGVDVERKVFLDQAVYEMGRTCFFRASEKKFGLFWRVK
jgi:hypothetical protein